MMTFNKGKGEKQSERRGNSNSTYFLMIKKTNETQDKIK